MAVDEGLRFGEQYVFTYGPLGFLQEPALYDETLWMLAFLYRGFLHVAVAVSLVWVARQRLPLAVAVALSYVLLVIGNLEGSAVLLAFIWCFVALGARAPRFAVPLVTVGGGALSAIEVLGKANFGIAILAMCTLTVIGLPNRRRNVPVLAAVFLAGIASLWLAAGQGISNVADHVVNTGHLLSGYSSSMNVDVDATSWELPMAPVAMALLIGGAMLAMWRYPAPRRLAGLGLVVLFAFVAFKQGFVRQGLGNTPNYFCLMLGAGIAVSAGLSEGRGGPGRRAGAFALIAPLLVLALAALPSPSLLRSLEPENHLTFLRGELRAFLLPAERDRAIAASRASMRSTYGLDRRTVSLIGNRPVHIPPWEIGVAWAYGLDWQPLPVIQDYLAYTPELDQINASALAGPGAPATILRQNPIAAGGPESIDDRYPAWEAPAANLSMLCHYGATRTTERWQLLERVAERCGPARRLSVRRAPLGAQIPVPPAPGPDQLVYARIAGVEVSGAERLRTFLYRARARTVAFDDGPSWRLVPETAQDGLILGAPRKLDFPAAFALAPNAETFSVQLEDGPPTIEVSFFAQRIRPVRASPTAHPQLNQ